MMGQIKIDDKSAFAAYSLPNEEDYFLIREDLSLDKKNCDTKGSFIIAPFISSMGSNVQSIRADHVLTNTPFYFKTSRCLKRQVISKGDYFKSANRFIDELGPKMDKIVLSRIKNVDISNINLFDLFIKLKSEHPSAFCYLFNLPESGCWIGASPELLLSWDRDKSVTMALAGTRKISHNNIKSWSDKNLQEQKEVAKYVKAMLDENKLSYKASNLENKKAGQIEHLCTTYTIDNLSKPMELLAKLHPTPAVCGWPKDLANQFIQDNEYHERRYYAGYLGPVHIHSSSFCFVNLRCMELSKNEGYVYVGGGIMPSSTPESEWIETEQKADTLLSIIDTMYFSAHAFK